MSSTAVKPCWCVIPAAGSGSRFGGHTPKQYLPVAGKPVLLHTLEALLTHPGIAGVVLVLPASGECPVALPQTCHGKPVLRTLGGASRAESVANGLAALPADVADTDIVLVHDAARPNLAHADVDALLAALQQHHAGALLAAPVRDTLKRADRAGQVLATEPRQALWRALTPQAFARKALANALAAAASQGIEVTDEAMAMELAGEKILLVEGREDNFKITTPADLARFAWLKESEHS
ncbi:2-C-methyl-D-erythritol 4-phosphate cytidylyltransferase [Lysobacteraceae bacterium NML75-0749]|nr:2-C-methyl-D-erythritol 4-phosphate cytidylyltransferase [Xanthomonadaceae bacterium NML75-0749]PJK05460.1 2-C-methyl-D-erythritol 4-phosphate cytidylyltransferase [Xanthomonadaceae bacterium NML91-0268]